MSSVDRRAAERIRVQLGGWVPFIRRATYASSAFWTLHEDVLCCTVRWDKSNKETTYSIAIERLFDSLGEPTDKPCTFAKEVVRHILGYK